MSTYSEDEVHRTSQIARWCDKRRQADEAIEAEVACGRREGMSWAKIGLALGTSAQAAWQRYGMTYEQKQQLALAQERRFEQLKIDVENMPAPVSDLKTPRQKRKRNQADR